MSIVSSPGSLMVAITDPGKSLEAIPHKDDLREVFLNPSDIGGRYSALTYVGLVPASLMGLSISELLNAALLMLDRCRTPDPATNPGLGLGLALGSLALAAPTGAGRDKVTFVADPEIASLGSWLEQLIAESTGKQGVGIVPVDLEPLGEPSARMAPTGSSCDSAWRAPTGRRPRPTGPPPTQLLEQLAAAGHPVIRITLADPIDIAGEFVRWEFATAIAGAVLGIDAFDQPNVEEAKVLTRQLLSIHGEAGQAGLHEVPAAPADLLASDFGFGPDRRPGPGRQRPG